MCVIGKLRRPSKTTADPSRSVDLAIPVGGRITGTVTDHGTGAPVENIAVELRGSDGAFAGDTATAADGSYEFTDLPPSAAGDG